MTPINFLLSGEHTAGVKPPFVLLSEMSTSFFKGIPDKVKRAQEIQEFKSKVDFFIVCKDEKYTSMFDVIIKPEIKKIQQDFPDIHNELADFENALDSFLKTLKQEQPS
jgi:hypothetical protein